MIVPMRKIYLVARRFDRRRLMDAIAGLGVVHLVPVDPSLAVPDKRTVDQIQTLRRALQLLHSVSLESPAPDLSAHEAAQEVLDIMRRRATYERCLTELHYQLRQLDMWGDFQRNEVDRLEAKGIALQFYSVPASRVQAIAADCAAVVGRLAGRKSLVALVARDEAPQLPTGAVRLTLPQRDASSIRAEAAEIGRSIKADRSRLGQLAHLASRMRAELERLETRAAETVALRGAKAGDHLFAMQGWVPEDKASSLIDDLADTGIPTAVRLMKATDEEEPPTWIHSPAWTRPIEGLFSMMGTVAGYREFDVSVPFLIALPVFTAILISDGGYGAVLLLALTLGYRPATRLFGERFTQLLMVVGAVALCWGIVCANFFGVRLYPPFISVDLSAHSRMLMMKICFVMGAVHLSIAQLWQAIRAFPHLRLLNRVGWAVFIWGMLGVVQRFVLRTSIGWETPWPYFLLVGATLAILFFRPSRNPVRMVTLGIAVFPLSMLSAFSDVISYVRLMAVGLASSVLAASFNELACGVGVWPLAMVILVLGHSLNMGLAMIAMFAHGVRLNMLEFCNNLGMKWTGYPYSPYSTQVCRKKHYGSGATEF